MRKGPPEKRLTPEEIEDLTYEIILFCMKWGLWFLGDIDIYSNGKRYSEDFGSEQVGNPFRGLKGVLVTEVNLEDYMPEQDEAERLLLFKKPEHILSLAIDGRFFCLKHYCEYTATFSDLTPEGKAVILERTSFLEDLEDDCLGDAENWDEYFSVDLDPLDFDSYEDYQELTDILDNRDWRLPEIKAKLEETDIICAGFDDPVVAYIRAEFDAIFDKYDLCLFTEADWWLTCRFNSPEVPLDILISNCM